MAHSIEKWELVREYFEANLSLSEIEKRTGISKSQISKKSKMEKWEKGNKKKQLIDQAVGLEVQKETLKETALKVHNEIVSERTKHIKLFTSSALNNQEKANKLLDSADKLSEVESHSRITAKNKETVLGKEIDTQVNIQNNTINKNIELTQEQAKEKALKLGVPLKALID